MMFRDCFTASDETRNDILCQILGARMITTHLRYGKVKETGKCADVAEMVKICLPTMEKLT